MPWLNIMFLSLLNDTIVGIKLQAWINYLLFSNFVNDSKHLDFLKPFQTLIFNISFVE